MSDFFTELRDRKVYRTAAIYAGAAFIVWQVADIALPALGAPDWVMRVIVLGALIGFPIALVLAWLIDLAPGSARVLRFGIIGVVAVALLGGAAALVARVGGADREQDVADRTLAVLPFHVRGSAGLEYLRDGLVDLLSRNLGGTDLHAVDPAAIVKAAESHGDDALTVDDAAAIARRVGAGQFVLGGVNQVGGVIRIHATLYVLRDSIEQVATSRAEGDTLELFAMVDRLTAELLAGRPTGAASRRVVRTAATTTSSLDALKLYLEGERFFRGAQHDSAIALFGEAIERDSAFTLARTRRALSHVLNDQFGPAREEIVRLRGEAARLSEHDRRVLEAFDAHAHGRTEDATRLYRAVVRDYPADVEAKVLLASLLVTYSQVRAEPLTEARELLSEVEALDPGFLCIACMQQTIASQDRDFERIAELKRHLRGAAGRDTTRDPQVEFLAALRARRDTVVVDSVLDRAIEFYDDDDLEIATMNGMYQYAILLGRFDVVEQLIDLARERDMAEDLRADREFRLAMATGRMREAAALIEERGAEAGLTPPWQAFFCLSNPAFVLPNLDALRSRLASWRVDESADSSESFDAELRLFFLALTDARSGDLHGAARWADSIAARPVGSSPFHRPLIDGMAAVVRADIAWRSGDPERALALLERVDDQLPPDLLDNEAQHIGYAARLRGNANLDAGRFEEALRWLRYSDVGTMPFASYAEWHLAMARSLDGLGRRDEAADYYARALDAWRNADPELRAQVDYARQRLTALRIE